MEIWDAYDKDENILGVDLIRGEEIPEGMYHLVCEVLVRHKDGSFLLMQRDWVKKDYPGYFEATAGGSALKGENAFDCIKRELFEETGINEDDFKLINKLFTHSSIFYSFFVETNATKDSIVLQKGETISYKWVNRDGFIEYINSDEAIPSQRDRLKKFLINENC